MRFELGGLVVDMDRRDVFWSGSDNAIQLGHHEYALLEELLRSPNQSVQIDEFASARGLRPDTIQRTTVYNLRRALGQRNPRIIPPMVRHSGRVVIGVPVRVFDVPTEDSLKEPSPSKFTEWLEQVPLPHMRLALQRVLESPQFPFEMANNEMLGPNPVWNHVAHNLAQQPISWFQWCEVFLLVAQQPAKLPRVYFYYQPRWDTHFFPYARDFCETTTALEAAARNIFQRFASPIDALQVRPTRHFLASVKPNPEQGNRLWIYLARFHNLVFSAPTRVAGDNIGWLDLPRLTDETRNEARLNGDFLFLLRTRFGDALEGLARTTLEDGED